VAIGKPKRPGPRARRDPKKEAKAFTDAFRDFIQTMDRLGSDSSFERLIFSPEMLKIISFPVQVYARFPFLLEQSGLTLSQVATEMGIHKMTLVYRLSHPQAWTPEEARSFLRVLKRAQ